MILVLHIFRVWNFSRKTKKIRSFFAKNEKFTKNTSSLYFCEIILEDKNEIIVESEFPLDNLIRFRITLILIKILFQFGKTGHFWGYFRPNLVIFGAIFREISWNFSWPIFREEFLAKPFFVFREKREIVQHYSKGKIIFKNAQTSWAQKRSWDENMLWLIAILE